MKLSPCAGLGALSLLLALLGCSSGDGGGSSAAAATAPPPPEIQAVIPAKGPVEGGATVVITGRHFRDDASDPDRIQVWFGFEPAANVLLLSDSELRVVTPPGTAGTVDVRVMNDDGRSTTLGGAYTYESNLAPAIDSVEPALGPSYGLTAVTIRGRGFLPGATVRFGGSLSQRVQVVDAKNIEALTPYGQAGAANVQVQNPDNQLAVLPRGFTYQDQFRIEGVSFSADLDRLSPGRTDHPVNVPVTVKFNRPLDPSSVTENTFSFMTRESKRATGLTLVKGDSVVFQPDVKIEQGKVVFGFNKGAIYVLDIPDVNRGATIRALGGEPLRRSFTWELATNQDPKDFNNAQPRMSLKVPVIKDPKVDQAKLDTLIVVQFDEIVMPDDVMDPAAVLFEVEVTGYPKRLPVEGVREVGVDPLVNGTFLKYTPARLLPSLSKVWITADPGKIHDLVGKTLDPATKEFSFLTESGSGYQSALIENFADTQKIDWNETGAPWSGGVLRPGRLGGSGLLGALEVWSGVTTLNTDNQLIDGSRTLTGQPVTVTDGVFSFSRIFVASGATLRFTGSKVARLLARGGVHLEGRLEANGEAAPATNGASTATTGGRGGNGGPGGANGGAGGSRSGVGPVDGQNGADVRVPPGHPAAAQAAGTGGRGSAANPAGADPNKVTFNAYFGYYSQQAAAGGGGGGFFAAGTKGSHTIPEVAFPGDLGTGGAGGAAFPVLPLALQLPTNQQLPIGGSGGGGAGLHAGESPSFGAKEWHPGAGGGGGGGAFLIQVGGDMTLAGTGVLAAKGGHGGPAQAGTAAAPGGGGSGGSIVFQVARLFSPGGRVDVSGGLGASTQGGFVAWKSTSGPGAPGYIRVEHDPILPHTSLTGFVPAATADNTGLLGEVNPVTGAMSLWYNTVQVKVTWLRFELKVKEGTQVVTYSDQAALGKAPQLGVTPVAFFLQGTVLDANGKPGTLTPWLTQAGPLNAYQPLPLAVRFIVILDTSKLPVGQDLEVQEVKVVYAL